MLEAEIVMDELNNNKFKNDKIEEKEDTIKNNYKEYNNQLNDSFMSKLMNEILFDEIPKRKVYVKK